MSAKILVLDIETAPNIAYVWSAWKQNVGQNQVIDRTYIMSYAAKWLGSDEIIYEENRKKSSEIGLISSLLELLDEADIVVAHNGKKFDLPVILGRAVVLGLYPPSPYHIVDTLQIARRRFRFFTNRLSNIAEELGVTEKSEHKKFPGFELWLECLRQNDEAWDEMRKYNIQDVLTLEEVYLRMLPYIDNHPNVARPDEDGQVLCAKCGSHRIQWRGYYYTKMGLCYRRFQCQDCGGWGRVRFAEKDIPVSNGRNAV